MGLQAKGVLARVHDVDVDAAFELLRGYARSRNRRLVELARLVVTDPRKVPDLTT